jgi:hypothetical protein
VETLPESEDFAVTAAGTILMAQGTTVFRWNGREGGDWQPVGDLSAGSITRVTRIAVAPDDSRIAFVAIREGAD